MLSGVPPPPPPLPPPQDELEPPPKPPFADEEEEEEMLLRETCLMSMANKRVAATEVSPLGPTALNGSNELNWFWYQFLVESESSFMCSVS